MDNKKHKHSWPNQEPHRSVLRGKNGKKYYSYLVIVNNNLQTNGLSAKHSWPNREPHRPVPHRKTVSFDETLCTVRHCK